MVFPASANHPFQGWDRVKREATRWPFGVQQATMLVPQTSDLEILATETPTWANLSAHTNPSR
jgi:hypothetical protein